VKNQVEEGWVWLWNARKAHYAVDSRSLCGREVRPANVLTVGKDGSPDNCMRCLALKIKSAIARETGGVRRQPGLSKP